MIQTDRVRTGLADDTLYTNLEFAQRQIEPEIIDSSLCELKIRMERVISEEGGHVKV